ncbi:MAG: epoxyqueuosine reductase QueH [Christensenellales bacterium]
MKKKMLLHSCCGPCSTSVIDRLKDEYDLTIFYYNPNIYPQEEYQKRLAEQQKYVRLIGLDIVVVDGKYDDNADFESHCVGLEKEKEGGARCSVCFAYRLDKTAQYAKQNGYDIFATTLTVSPHKNAKVINEIGLNIAQKYNIDYLVADFKKQDGYLKSIRLSQKYSLYRQNYCGCKFSLHE